MPAADAQAWLTVGAGNIRVLVPSGSALDHGVNLGLGSKEIQIPDTEGAALILRSTVGVGDITIEEK